LVIVAPDAMTRGTAATISAAATIPGTVGSGTVFKVEAVKTAPLTVLFSYTAAQAGCTEGEATCAATLSLTIPTTVEAGDYTVTVTVTDATGKSTSVNDTVVVN
jgi:hypothetical protein